MNPRWHATLRRVLPAALLATAVQGAAAQGAMLTLPVLLVQ
jgi:hypothetical protein